MRILVTPIPPALYTCHRLTVLLLAGVLVTGCASPAKTSKASASRPLAQTVYSDDGVSELSVPTTWTVRPDFGRDAAIRVAEGNGKAFLLINSYQPGEIANTTIAAFSHSYAEGLAESLPNATTSDGEGLEINGAPAHRHVVTGDVGGVRLTYVSTVTKGRSSLHHLIGWTAASDYQHGGGDLDRVMGSFRESLNPRTPKQRIALSFAWPDSLQSAANYRQTSVRRGKANELKAIYLTTVSPGDENELFVRTRIMSQNTQTAQSAEHDLTSTLARQLTAEIPDYVVSRDGEFIRVANLPAYQQRVETALVSKLPPDETGQKDRILALVKPHLTEQFLAAAATNEWNKTVGGWVGSSYVPGQTYRFNEAYYSPPLGDTPFVMNVSRQVPGFTRCNNSQSDCVKLLQTATVDGDDFSSAMRRFLETTLGQKVRLREISIVKNMEIIAEPGTLIPHRLRSSEETTVTIEDADGKLHTSRDTEDTSVTYNYESYTASR
ncbi:MAG TPA: hypothetical protein VMW70_08085 [Burkholderiales bacterium]|nr:hypothetical protein [Burkholderiales bacterium]